MPTGSYWHQTRTPRYSLTLALPLLLLYEALAAALGGTGPALRNGADVILQQVIIGAVGPSGPLYVTAAVIVLCITWIVRDVRRNGAIRVGWLPRMLGEAAVLALLLGLVVGIATAQLLRGLGVSLMLGTQAQPAALDPATALMLSLGAGLYEELLFRVLLVTAFAAGARALFGVGRTAAGVAACVASALVFSAFHYVGPYGDPFELASFTFRALAGLTFSGLYLARGFGITAWTHALYDVYVLVL